MRLRALTLALLLVGGPLAAADRVFTIGGEAFAEDDVVDARAVPDISGKAIIMLTLADQARERLSHLTSTLVGKEAPMVLDGRTIGSPIVREPITGGVLHISGSYTVEEAEALAKTISGKDPLPESLED